MTQVVVGRAWDWQRHLPRNADPRAAGMTRAQARHWRRMAPIAAAETPQQRLHEAVRLLVATLHGHPVAQDTAAEVLVTLATSTVMARRMRSGDTEWVLNDTLGAGLDLDDVDGPA